MKTIKFLSTLIAYLTIFGVLLTAAFIAYYDYTIFLTQSYVLLYYLGICVLIIILAFKIADYAAIFLSPHKSMLFTLIQLAFLPFIVMILVNKLHLPVTIATAVGCAALSPGSMAKNLFKNLFLAACVLFVGMFLLPNSSQTVNQIYETTTSSHTKYVILIIAFTIFVIYEIYDHKQKKNQQPDEVYYIKEN